MSSKIIRRSWTDEQLIEAVKTSKTRAEVSRKLGLTTYGANSKTIKKRIEVLGLDISHFLTNTDILREARTFKSSMSNDELFSINNIDRQYIKRVIIRDNLLSYECSKCHIISWQNEPLSLHLDHINGINNDHRLCNLRFLCPNCHSQTETYCGKKLKNRTYEQPHCLDCGKVIQVKSIRCVPCASKHRRTKIVWIDTQSLVRIVEELGYQGAGRKLGVSGNAIKKRIRNHPNYIPNS